MGQLGGPEALFALAAPLTGAEAPPGVVDSMRGQHTYKAVVSRHTWPGIPRPMTGQDFLDFGSRLVALCNEANDGATHLELLRDHEVSVGDAFVADQLSGMDPSSLEKLAPAIGEETVALSLVTSQRERNSGLSTDLNTMTRADFMALFDRAHALTLNISSANTRPGRSGTFARLQWLRARGLTNKLIVYAHDHGHTAGPRSELPLMRLLTRKMFYVPGDPYSAPRPGYSVALGSEAFLDTYLGW